MLLSRLSGNCGKKYFQGEASPEQREQVASGPASEPFGVHGGTAGRLELHGQLDLDQSLLLMSDLNQRFWAHFIGGCKVLTFLN